MKRRDFIHFGSLVGAGLTTSLYSACDSNEPSAAVFNDDFELKEKTIRELIRAMESGQLTCEQITTLYLKRIEKIDVEGPGINSVIEVNPHAIPLAKELDKERLEGKIRGPLHGIPLMLKDNIDTGDKMMTTAGSLALEGHYAAQDAPLVRQLRNAGALILGKTNLSEWANFRSTRSSSGWSGRGGQTKNPYAINRNPCGSSSGSGAAVSANLCAGAVGTETDGSVVCPSNANGLVGIKPTVGLVSRTGIIPISKTQDTAGPMARNVEDAAIMLSAMAGMDPEDEATQKAGEHIKEDYTLFLNKKALQGARIGVARERFGFHEDVDDALNAGIEVLKAQGAAIIDLDKIYTNNGIQDAEFTVLLYEFKDGLNKYLSGLKDTQVQSLKDLIEFNKTHKDKEMPFFQQEILVMAEEKEDLSSKEYLDALELCRETSQKNGIDRVMNENNLDAIVAPTGGPAWVTDLVTGDHFLGGSSDFAAIAGYPNITVPAGFVQNLPVGMSFFGRAFSEDKLIGLAYAFEQATKHRKAPGFIDYV
ncbi:MAG: amidase [Bacteroidota bacterium]